jgi:hypothetical protein
MVVERASADSPEVVSAASIAGWGARGLGLALRDLGVGFAGFPEGGVGVNMAATAPADPLLGSAEAGLF